VQIAFKIQIQDAMDGRMSRGMEIREWGLRKVHYIYFCTLRLCLQKVSPFGLRSDTAGKSISKHALVSTQNLAIM